MSYFEQNTIAHKGRIEQIGAVFTEPNNEN